MAQLCRSAICVPDPCTSAAHRLDCAVSLRRSSKELLDIRVREEMLRGLFHCTGNPTPRLLREFRGLNRSLGGLGQYDAPHRAGEHLPFGPNVRRTLLTVRPNSTYPQIDLIYSCAYHEFANAFGPVLKS